MYILEEKILFDGMCYNIHRCLFSDNNECAVLQVQEQVPLQMFCLLDPYWLGDLMDSISFSALRSGWAQGGLARIIDPLRKANYVFFNGSISAQS